MKRLTAEDPESLSAGHRAENVEQLKALFPAAFPAGKLDFGILTQLLGGAVDEREEKYALIWRGKRRARQLALTPATGTLRPCPEDSVDWHATQNLMIEGDNLEVLKLLQKSYAGKVKLIYIDPPYNTGQNLVYPDDFKGSIRSYRDRTAQPERGRKVSRNAEAGGRLHTDWLNMLYPRLLLARRLLCEGGMMAVSIDDSELPRLVLMVEEVFGVDNVINVVAVKSSETSGVKMSHVAKRLPKIKEYLVLAARNRDALQLAPIQVPKNGGDGAKLDRYLGYYGKIITNPDDAPDTWQIVDLKDEMRHRGLAVDSASVRAYKLNNAERVVYRTNNPLLSRLSFPTATAEVMSPTGLRYIWWEGKQMLFLCDYLKESLCDLWTDISTINLNKEICGVEGFGQGQKPLELIARLLQMMPVGDEGAIVLDFFAGSGTTGHAVLAQNAADGGRRRFILVQLPEPLDPESRSQATAAAFCDRLGRPRHIAELTKERLRRAAQRIKDEYPKHAGDLGFRTFTLVSRAIGEADQPAPVRSRRRSGRSHITATRT